MCFVERGGGTCVDATTSNLSLLTVKSLLHPSESDHLSPHTGLDRVRRGQRLVEGFEARKRYGERRRGGG